MRLIIDNLKRISLDTHYLDSLIFKLNFEALGVHQGLGLSPSCSEIDPKVVQKNLKDLVDYLEKASKIEQAVIIRRYIKDIFYSKESIQINMLCQPEVIDRQSIKNPAPLEESGVFPRIRSGGFARGRARAAVNPTVQISFQKNSPIGTNRAIQSMAPPRGLGALHSCRY